MIDLNNVPHDTNWARVTITRLGEGRHTRHRILADEQPQATPEPTPQLQPVNKQTRLPQGTFIEEKYGHHFQ